MVVTLRRSVALNHAATDRPGRSVGNDTVSSTCYTKRKCSTGVEPLRQENILDFCCSTKSAFALLMLVEHSQRIR